VDLKIWGDPLVPNVKRIVYSTCSIHASENEHVVRDALSSDEAKAGSFSIASRNEVLPDWPRRGFAEEMNSTGDVAFDGLLSQANVQLYRCCLCVGAMFTGRRCHEWIFCVLLCTRPKYHTKAETRSGFRNRVKSAQGKEETEEEDRAVRCSGANLNSPKWYISIV
jgi:hypothetical protein